MLIAAFVYIALVAALLGYWAILRGAQKTQASACLERAKMARLEAEDLRLQAAVAPNDAQRALLYERAALREEMVTYWAHRAGRWHTGDI